MECGIRIFAAHAAESASELPKPHRRIRTKMGISAIPVLNASGRLIAMMGIMLRHSTEPTTPPAQCAGPLKETVS